MKIGDMSLFGIFNRQIPTKHVIRQCHYYQTNVHCPFIRSHGLWKFNNSLLYDDVYVANVKQTIQEIKKQYRKHSTTKCRRSKLY